MSSAGVRWTYGNASSWRKAAEVAHHAVILAQVFIWFKAHSLIELSKVKGWVL